MPTLFQRTNQFVHTPSSLQLIDFNILILAHAVVPHHHHNKVFVAIVNILDHDAQDIFNHKHGHEHHHDGGSDHHNVPAHHHDGDSEDCLMSEAEAAAALKIHTDDDESHSIAPLQDNDDGNFILLAVEAGNGIATNGTVTINTSMNSGEIAIVKIGGKSVKVVVK